MRTAWQSSTGYRLHRRIKFWTFACKIRSIDMSWCYQALSRRASYKSTKRLSSPFSAKWTRITCDSLCTIVSRADTILSNEGPSGLPKKRRSWEIINLKTLWYTKTHKAHNKKETLCAKQSCIACCRRVADGGQQSFQPSHLAIHKER